MGRIIRKQPFVDDTMARVYVAEKRNAMPLTGLTLSKHIVKRAIPHRRRSSLLSMTALFRTTIQAWKPVLRA